MAIAAVVGTAQALAETWAIADEDVRNASRRVVEMKAAHDHALRRQEEASRALMERVGRNITTKVFKVGADVVIVEHERGIRRLQMEV